MIIVFIVKHRKYSMNFEPIGFLKTENIARISYRSPWKKEGG